MSFYKDFFSVSISVYYGCVMILSLWACVPQRRAGHTRIPGHLVAAPLGLGRLGGTCRPFPTPPSHPVTLPDI